MEQLQVIVRTSIRGRYILYLYLILFSFCSILCERRTDTMCLRIDLCSMGNSELLVIFENPPPSSSPSLSYTPPNASPSKHMLPEETFSIRTTLSKPNTLHRIVCRYQPDTR